jgi:hypothetical protein
MELEVVGGGRLGALTLSCFSGRPHTHEQSPTQSSLLMVHENPGASDGECAESPNGCHHGRHKV